MKAAAAIRKFLGSPGTNPEMNYIRPTMGEIKELKDSCMGNEWQEFGKQACDIMGETFEPVGK